MNIALEQTEEHVGGRVINRYGDAFIRGNNGGSKRSPDQNLPPTSFLSSPLYLGRRNPIEAAVRGPNPTFDPLAPKNLLLVFHVLPMWISFYEL